MTSICFFPLKRMTFQNPSEVWGLFWLTSLVCTVTFYIFGSALEADNLSREKRLIISLFPLFFKPILWPYLKETATLLCSDTRLGQKLYILGSFFKARGYFLVFPSQESDVLITFAKVAFISSLLCLLKLMIHAVFSSGLPRGGAPLNSKEK